MKAEIHPEYMPTKVKCNGCGQSFDSHSTVAEITVEICSNCHPFYTGKQKLLDTAGRVDKFEARRRRAAELKSQKAPKAQKPADDMTEIEQELKAETVDIGPTDATPEA